MAVTNFDTINGHIVSEHSGSTQLDYLSDALGSVIGVCDQTGSVVGTARYKPYGTTLASSGTQASLGWIGRPGYRPTGLKHAEFYVRMRHYSHVDGRWTTVDLMWPDQNAYAYASASPTVRFDPSGLWCATERGGATGGNIGRWGRPVGQNVLNSISNDPGWNAFLDCLSGCPQQYPQSLGSVDSTLQSMADADPGCADPSLQIAFQEGGWWPFYNLCNNANVCSFTNQLSRPPRITICQQNRGNCGSLKCQVAHELIHATGVQHARDDHWFNCVRLLGGCENYNPTNVNVDAR